MRLKMGKVFFFFIFAVCIRVFATPEEQIIIRENFITPEEAALLIDFYDAQKQGNYSAQTDNILPMQDVSDRTVRTLVQQISDRILELIARHYQPNRIQQLDFCAFFSRIKGNSAIYHADNIRFECPIHGTDQNQLRATCNGTCPGSRFVPNHTGWRTYTGLVYLDDDFEGGEIVFEDGPCQHTYQKVIPIQAGMLVLSPDGSDFYHEVLRMRRGIRHSIHFWFTDNPRYFYRW